MKNFLVAIVVCMGGAILASCDLQPAISSIPDSIGDFISTRYPALLADPNTEPEIYNSAVSDYGVYASPELYGSGDTGDYVNYVGIDDYILRDDAQEKTTQNDDNPEPQSDVADEKDVDIGESVESTADEDVDTLSVPEYNTDEIYVPARAAAGTVIVRRGDTLSGIARSYNMTLDEIAKANNLGAPYTIRTGQVLKIKSDMPVIKVADAPKKDVEPIVKEAPKPQSKPEIKSAEKVETKKIEHKKPMVEPTQKSEVKIQKDIRVPIKNITVTRGDTLYSISRQYSVPVNDLAVMNGLSAPFNLGVGQTLRVPDLQMRSVTPEQAKKSSPVVKKAKSETVVPKETTKTKVDPKVESGKKSVKNTKETKKAEVKKSNEKKLEKKKIEKQDTTKKQSVTTQKKPAPKQVSEQPKIMPRSSTKFTWPVRGTVLSHYGAKDKGMYNDGINIGAALNAPVVAAENGVVAYAGNEVRGMGNLIIIQHSDGWMTVYAHMNSMAVRRGARVSVGQKIGAVGKTGRIAKPQLHFEIRKGTKSYNPINYLKK